MAHSLTCLYKQYITILCKLVLLLTKFNINDIKRYIKSNSKSDCTNYLINGKIHRSSECTNYLINGKIHRSSECTNYLLNGKIHRSSECTNYLLNGKIHKALNVQTIC